MEREGKVEPGVPVHRLRAQIFDFPQPTAFQPFPGGNIGSLRVHIDKPLALLHGDQVILGLPRRVVGTLAPDRRPGHQQFPAPPCIFHVNHLRLPADFHMGDKAVWPAQEGSGNHIGIVHGRTPFF